MKKALIRTLSSKILAFAIVASTLCLLSPVCFATKSYAAFKYPTDEEAEMENRILAEMEEGYTYEQICDQINEEVYGIDGYAGTGGKDGKLLDGTPAPNAPGNIKPTCDHSYAKESTKEATCTEKGKITYKCDKCGDTYTESIPKVDHVFAVTDEVTGTCLVTGYRVETCSVCGLEQTLDGVYGDHVLAVNGDQKEPTCEEAGVKTEQCTVCFEVFTTELPATGHAFETKPTVDVEATCGSTGKQSYHCANCDATTGEEVIPALGHDVTTEEKEAGVFEDGYTKDYCARCGEVFSDVLLESFVMKNIVYIIAGAVVVLAGVVGGTIFVKKKKVK